MQGMIDGGFRPIVRAYALIAVWCGLSLLTGVHYRIFDKQLNIQSSRWDMLLLAESRSFSFALLTLPIFYLARRSIGVTHNRFRFVLGCAWGVLPFMLLNACFRWVALPPWDGVLQNMFLAPRKDRSN